VVNQPSKNKTRSLSHKRGRTITDLYKTKDNSDAAKIQRYQHSMKLTNNELNFDIKDKFSSSLGFIDSRQTSKYFLHYFKFPEYNF
jgi:hypothetical protein